MRVGEINIKGVTEKDCETITLLASALSSVWHISAQSLNSLLTKGWTTLKGFKVFLLFCLYLFYWPRCRREKFSRQVNPHIISISQPAYMTIKLTPNILNIFQHCALCTVAAIINSSALHGYRNGPLQGDMYITCTYETFIARLKAHNSITKWKLLNWYGLNSNIHWRVYMNFISFDGFLSLLFLFLKYYPCHLICI